MRVLHVVPSYYPAVRYGGPIRSVHDLCSALARRGHEVHVLTTNIDGPSFLTVPLGVPVELDGVWVWYFPLGLGRRFCRSPHLGLALQSRVSKFDIVHLHSVFLWPTSAAAAVARRAGVPYVLAPRGMLVANLVQRKSSLAKRAWIKLFESRNIESAATVHLTSKKEAEEFKGLELNYRRLDVIPNGIDSTPGTSNRTATQELSRDHRRLFILYLGRVNWKKGLDRLIPSMKRVPKVELVIAGNDEENYRPMLEKLAVEHGIADRVVFTGPVHGPEKWEWLRAAAMLVLPSYSENFGMVVLEAMAVGCPVVVTPEVGLADTVQESGSGVVVDGTPENLAEAINCLLVNDDARRRMGEAGMRTARERFSWGAIAERMEGVYLEILQDPRRLRQVR